MTTYFKWKTKKKSDYRYYLKTKSYIVYRGKKKTKRISEIRWKKYEGKAKLY